MSKSAADRYREKYTSFRDAESVRAGVYYPDHAILWTTWREEAAREALEGEDEDDKDDKEKAQKQLDQFESAKDEPEPIVLVPVGEVTLRDLKKRRADEDISDLEHDALHVIACARMPKFDKDDEFVLESGRPVPGQPLYTKANLDYMLSDDHLVGGKLFRLRTAVAQYIAESSVEVSKAGKLTSG